MPPQPSSRVTRMLLTIPFWHTRTLWPECQMCAGISPRPATPASGSSSPRPFKGQALSEHTLQETQSAGGDRILGRRQRSPDCRGSGDRLVLDREGLDHQGSLVSGITKRGNDFWPRDLVRSGCTAVTAARVKVGQVSAAQPNRRRRIVLLDVHVKGVEQHAEGGRSDPIHNL